MLNDDEIRAADRRWERERPDVPNELSEMRRAILRRPRKSLCDLHVEEITEEKE